MNEELLLEERKYRGGVVRVFYDNYSENPREFYEPTGKFVTWGRNNGGLGDETPKETPDEWLRKHRGLRIILPVFVYEHSGKTVSTTPFSCPWDSGQLGWIYMTVKQARKIWGSRIPSGELVEKGKAALKAEIEEFDNYLTGQVYRYEAWFDGEACGDCCGFYGEEGLEYAFEVGFGEIDSTIQRMRNQRISRLKLLIAARVPLWVRENQLAAFDAAYA